MAISKIIILWSKTIYTVNCSIFVLRINNILFLHNFIFYLQHILRSFLTYFFYEYFIMTFIIQIKIFFYWNYLPWYIIFYKNYVSTKNYFTHYFIIWKNILSYHKYCVYRNFLSFIILFCAYLFYHNINIHP